MVLNTMLNIWVFVLEWQRFMLPHDNDLTPLLTVFLFPSFWTSEFIVISPFSTDNDLLIAYCLSNFSYLYFTQKSLPATIL
jgi:hypothetical protein